MYGTGPRSLCDWSSTTAARRVAHASYVESFGVACPCGLSKGGLFLFAFDVGSSGHGKREE